MKADLIYTLDHADPYRREMLVIAKSGKWIDMDGWKPRLHSIVWGAYSPERAKEARGINELQAVVNTRRKALNEALRATQPTLIAAAKAAPKDLPTLPPEQYEGKLEV